MSTDTPALKLNNDAIESLDTGVRGGPDPDSIPLEGYGREIPEA